MKESDTEGVILRAVEMNDRLERTPRTGYSLSGVCDPETVAAHCYGVAWLTGLLCRQLVREGVVLDRTRAIEMALLHETGEIFIGDLVPGTSRVLGPGIKEDAERVSGGNFLSSLDEEMAALFAEYLEGNTPEARLVRDGDRLQLLLKAAAYRRDGQRGVRRLLDPAKYSFAYGLCTRIAGRLFDELRQEGLLDTAPEPPWESCS